MIHYGCAGASLRVVSALGPERQVGELPLWTPDSTSVVSPLLSLEEVPGSWVVFIAGDRESCRRERVRTRVCDGARPPGSGAGGYEERTCRAGWELHVAHAGGPPDSSKAAAPAYIRSRINEGECALLTASPALPGASL